MNVYIVIIALLLGVVTFLGFQAVQEPEGTTPNTGIATQTEDSTDNASIEDSDMETSEVKGSSVAGRTIDLSGTNLSKVPGYVFDTRNVTTLDVSNNNLNGALQAEVRHLQDLKVLNLSNNNFTGLPAEIGQLSKLEVLNLSGNPITGLPLELGNLKNLQVLDLRDTQYSAYDLNIIIQSLPNTVHIKK